MTTGLKKPLALVLLLGLIGVGIYALGNGILQNKSAPPQGNQNIPGDLKHYSSYLARQKKMWTQQIKKDPQEAYRTFVATTNKLTFDVHHALAHEFGALMFRLIGKEGTPICDGSFSFGCYHGFFGEVVKARGFKEIYSLDDACTRVKNPDNCQHGLGHAILVYYETNEHINDALAVCAKMKNYGPYGGCRNGIFMEYNYSNLRNTPGRPRPLTPDNAHLPCSRVEKEFQESCYFFQATWWRQANGATADSGHKTMGTLCAGLQEERLRKACFSGAGSLGGVESEDNIAAALKTCTQMPTSRGKVYCRMGLRSTLLSKAKGQKIADSMCTGLIGLDKKVCMNEAVF